MPPVRPTDFQPNAGFRLEPGGKSRVRKFLQQIGRVSEKSRRFESFPAQGIAWYQVRLGPVRHKNRSRKTPGMSRILDNLKLGSRVWQEIRNHGGDKLA